jgi:hypothetical protein
MSLPPWATLLLLPQIVYLPNLLLLWYLAGKEVALAWYALCMAGTMIAVAFVAHVGQP